MASLIKQFSGRKRECDVHKHFRYDADGNKSVCLVNENGKQCGFRVSGKNSTNLKSHIQHHHTDDTYEQLKAADDQLKSAKRKE